VHQFRVSLRKQFANDPGINPVSIWAITWSWCCSLETVIMAGLAWCQTIQHWAVTWSWCCSLATVIMARLAWCQTIQHWAIMWSRCCSLVTVMMAGLAWCHGTIHLAMVLQLDDKDTRSSIMPSMLALDHVIITK